MNRLYQVHQRARLIMGGIQAIDTLLMPDFLKSSTLMLAIHGSTEDSNPSRTAHGLAQSVRDQGTFHEVITGFYKHPPLLHQALRQAKGDRVFVVPMLMSSGYFAEIVFPKSLEISSDTICSFPSKHTLDGKRVIYCQPIGIHPGMEKLVIQSARRTLMVGPTPSTPSLTHTSLALVAHGTARHQKSRVSVERLVKSLQKQSGLFQDIRAFYIEERPFVREIVEWETPADHVVLVPFMLADGPHVSQDIPHALGIAMETIQHRMRKGTDTWKNPNTCGDKSIWISRPIGTSPGLKDLLIDTAYQAGLLLD
jgi:sirohydrochlorin cobaltochelatase